jgi:hypothetical protein
MVAEAPEEEVEAKEAALVLQLTDKSDGKSTCRLSCCAARCILAGPSMWANCKRAASSPRADGGKKG